MPLQNRVDPFGELFATPARGLLMGNRGGRLHDAQTNARVAALEYKAWICCRLEFKDRHRDVWGDSYTELFFLDEVTALAAGHRPCFECRRNDAIAFAERWQRAFALANRPRAADMDRVLHAERVVGRGKAKQALAIDDLPDGAMIKWNGGACAVQGPSLLHWTPHGYRGSERRPHRDMIDVLTPPAVLAVLAAGYRPLWHPSGSD